MEVNILELRVLTEKLFTHLKKREYSSIEISKDYYWDIPKEYRYDPYNDPHDFDLGQLTDDWTKLREITEGKNEAVGYALIWLSSVLRAIGKDIIG